jgi:hypothetical protein
MALATIFATARLRGNAGTKPNGRRSHNTFSRHLPFATPLDSADQLCDNVPSILFQDFQRISPLKSGRVIICTEVFRPEIGLQRFAFGGTQGELAGVVASQRNLCRYEIVVPDVGFVEGEQE